MAKIKSHHLIVVLLWFFFHFENLKGQDTVKKWNVNAPPLPYKEFNLKTQEGSWMNLDVSPDGNTIVFDLLGDIFIMPINGGKAKVLRSGLAFEVQPRFNPDGDKILFTSDAGGADNIWIMNNDGSNATQLTQENFRLLNNADWHPDGQYFVARKHFTSTRSLGAGEIWMYHKSGGNGIQITERKNDQQDVNEPAYSPNGKYIYFSEDMYPGGFFQYNKDPNQSVFVIRRYDTQESKIDNIIGGSGSAFRPTPSPDGKSIAYVRRDRNETILILHQLETGEEKILYRKLSKDQLEAWTIFGIYTGFSWTPDSENIIIWSQGKIIKINCINGKIQDIPFEVEVEHRIIEPLQFKQKCTQDTIELRAIRQCITSPDQKFIVFNAAGYLYRMNLADQAIKRIGTDKAFEFEPCFTPDGKFLIYVSWDDDQMGKILKMEMSSGKSKILNKHPGIYRTPSVSPDGKWIVYYKEGGNEHQGYLHCKNPGIYLIPLEGGEPKLLTIKGEYPQFDSKSERVYFQTGGYLFGSLSKSLKSVNLAGDDEKTHLTSTYANRFFVSPDNNWVAFNELFKIYIMAMPPAGKPLMVSKESKALPVAQITDQAGVAIHWAPDSKSIHWTQGNQYYTEQLTDRFAFLRNAADTLAPFDTQYIEIPLKIKADIPQGKIALTNARIITMEQDSVIQEGFIIILNNKIHALGTMQTYNPSHYGFPLEMDMKGKTIMPGLIDVHAHLGAFRFGLSPQKHWQYWTNLAFGVTTTHDPSSNSEMTFSQSEMVKTGSMVGPRIFSTGTILYGADGDFKATIENESDAYFALKRTKAWGAFSVKSYNQPRRSQRQMVIKAARDLNMLVVPEGGSFFYHNMSQVADGHTGIEHNIPVVPLYKDVLDFWSFAGSANTPTLIVNYGSVNGEFYWYQHTNVWENEKLLRFTPRPIIDSRSRHRTMIPEEEYENGHILTSKSCKKLQDRGVRINLGSHGQIQGLGAHWELWMLVQGGMSPLQALRSASWNGAKYLGMEDEIGSLKPGKLADLIILEMNPLDNIRNSESIRYTMINGRLFESNTMAQIYPEKKFGPEFYWNKSGAVYPYNFTNWSAGRANCSCQEHFIGQE